MLITIKCMKTIIICLAISFIAAHIRSGSFQNELTSIGQYTVQDVDTNGARITWKVSGCDYRCFVYGMTNVYAKKTYTNTIGLFYTNVYYYKTASGITNDIVGYRLATEAELEASRLPRF